MQYTTSQMRGVGENFKFYFGYVVDINDPRKAGRVKVVAIGFHTANDGSVIPTEMLPWSLVAGPTTSANVSGVGTTPHGLKVGSWVYGAFRDGETCQEPLVFGSIPGWMVDENGEFPREQYSNAEDEFLDPDVNLLARGDVGNADKVRNLSKDHMLHELKERIRTRGVPTALGAGGTWDELEYAHRLRGPAAEYTFNQVTETVGGHIFEVDDTNGSKRQHRWHPASTYEEIDDDGSVVTRVQKDNYKVVMGDDYCYVVGNVNLTIGGDCNMKIVGDWNVEVDGNKTEHVHGDVLEMIDGTKTEKGIGDVTEMFSSNQSTNVSGSITLKAGPLISLKAGIITLN